MKNVFFVLATVLVSVSVLAAPPAKETAQVVRALVANPSVTEQLAKNGSPALTDMQITQVKQGVFQYVLVFNRDCYCRQSTATVNILEDLTATYADGPVKYETSVTIKDGQD